MVDLIYCKKRERKKKPSIDSTPSLAPYINMYVWWCNSVCLFKSQLRQLLDALL